MTYKIKNKKKNKVEKTYKGMTAYVTEKNGKVCFTDEKGRKLVVF